MIRQKRRLHERPIANLSDDPTQHLQSLREDLVVRDRLRVEGVIVGCHAAAVVARFKEFGVVWVVPGIYVRNLFLLRGWGEREEGRERHIMPEIMHSYCSHMGTPLRSCARAMISGRLWVAAILIALGWDGGCWCWYCRC